VEAALGTQEAHAYTATLLQALATDAVAARVLALELPDHLARVDVADRGRFIALLQAVITDSPGTGPAVARALPRLLSVMDDSSLSDFVAQGVALHAGSARKAESFLRLESQGARTAVTTLQRGTGLLEVHRMLTHYARAHCGAGVRIRPGGDRAYTDGRHIYLPKRVAIYDDERDQQVYRLRTALSAGFIEFGSLEVDLGELQGDWPAPQPDETDLNRFFRSFPNTVLAKDLFRILEGARVEARVRDEYPGVARQMDAMGDVWREALPQGRDGTPAEQAVAYLAAHLRGAAPGAPKSPAAAQAVQDVLEVIQAVELERAEVAEVLRAIQKAFFYLYALLERAETGAPAGAPDPADYQSSAAAAGGVDVDAPNV